MSLIRNVVVENAPYYVDQKETVGAVRNLFGGDYEDIERLLRVFGNGEIKGRYLAAPLDWFEKERGLEEKNQRYVEESVRMGSRAVARCLEESGVKKEEIDAFIFVSSSGMSTPTIDARIMNELRLPPHIKRIPLWGLGCAGGASGISRAHDYCLAYPEAKVLVLCIELCSLTFQHTDRSKSNLIGTSLFADGAACALVTGDQVQMAGAGFFIKDTQSTLMQDSEDVMGWDVKDHGLHVVFSRDIPKIIEKWLKPNVDLFLEKIGKTSSDIIHFVAHPGGKKVLAAYEKSLGFSNEKTEISRNVLTNYGNMSSPTVLYVLKEFMETRPNRGEEGLLTALGPGFSSEMLWLEWGEVNQ
ncbi:3-oxoacyl-[acyl-carrier-protein] synthase III C-terminal domain-containing protein [Planococcus sp. N028]|uniref:3-oxoacyl-[acyl-carrier-protein] synthase III C-terminal domain-containing protein n=1 Tax=Planococcus shixiaomingii TaxID=3058393 RepID=A0ABT8N5Q7_9BACL|nr:3-oxoacyl-[acyl-carrier-protein] synthase III C-terminal domain-containing protein [Planococcus sp. N028]MDN7243224.1 3-oxoacyl-[acyl-carrier-protein] synthase III C-terminal domain-containing protein [Planococcus sp. N028]